MKKKTQDLIDKFLEERRKSDGGYAPVTENDINLLYKVIDSLLIEKFQEDPDGDLPVEIRIINRHTHDRSYYIPVPYEHKCKSEGDFLKWINVVTMNLDTASREMARATDQISKYMREVAKKDDDNEL